MKELEICSEEIKRLLAEQIKGICIVRRTVFEKRVKMKRRIKMPMDDKIKIQVFDVRDYKAWKKRIFMYLKCKKCYEPATREKMDTDAKDNWDEKNQWAMNYIYCSITNEQLEFVGDQDTAYKIIKKFDEMYMKESTALQLCIRRRLDMIMLKDFEESSSLFT